MKLLTNEQTLLARAAARRIVRAQVAALYGARRAPVSLDYDQAQALLAAAAAALGLPDDVVEAPAPAEAWHCPT